MRLTYYSLIEKEWEKEEAYISGKEAFTELKQAKITYFENMDVIGQYWFW